MQVGKSYDLTKGEGKRIWEECRAHAAKYPSAVPPGQGVSLHVSGERFGKPYLTTPRLGQGGFRVAVTDAYGRACAICTEHSLPVLEAAHIVPYGEGGDHDVRNGILFRADIHRLFDQGLVTVTDDYRFVVSKRLKELYDNGRAYYELEDLMKQKGGIHLPKEKTFHPDPDRLRWHSKNRFVA